MVLSFWIYIILFIVVVVLIFKFIKKIVVAIFSVIFLIFLIIGGVGALVYMDYQSIIEQDNYDVNLIYGSLDNPDFGLSFTIIKGEDFNKNSVSSIDVSKINEKFLDNLEDDDGFYIFISKEIYKDILKDNESYYLSGTEDLEIMGFKLETGLSKSEILKILNSDNSNQEYINLVLAKNDLPLIQGVDIEEFAKDLIKDQLGDITIKEALFSSSFLNLDNQDYIILFEGFKDDEVLIFPSKFSFSIVKLLPTKFIADKLN